MRLQYVQQMDKTLLIAFTEAGRRLGLAEKTARNWDSAGKFPVPTFLIGSRRMVRTEDLETFVAGLGAGSLPSKTTLSEVADIKIKKPRGRPRKTAAVVGKRGASNV